MRKKPTPKAGMSNSMFYICLVGLSLWIGSNFISRSQKVGRDANRPVRVASQANGRMEPVASTVSREAVPASIAGAPLQPSPQTESKGIFSNEVLSKLEDPSAPLSSVCDKLPKMNPELNQAISEKKLSERFNDSVFDRSVDPTLESVKPVLRYVLTQPSLKGLIGGRPDGFLENAEVSVQALRNYQALKSNREQLENILDQSYLLFMLGRSVEQNPKLASSPQVLRYCNSIETQLNHLGPTNFVEAKKAFGEFLQATDVDPASIGFDPEYETDLDLVLEDNSYGYNIGWLKQIIAAR